MTEESLWAIDCVQPLILEPTIRYKAWGVNPLRVADSFPNLYLGYIQSLGELILTSTQSGSVGQGKEAFDSSKTFEGDYVHESIRKMGTDFLGKNFAWRLDAEADDPRLYQGKPEAWYVWKVEGDVDIVYDIKKGISQDYINAYARDGCFRHFGMEDERMFYERLKADMLETAQAKEGQVFYNKGGKVHTVMCMSPGSYALIVETQKGYGTAALTMTSKILCVGNHGLSIQLHPSKEQVQAVLNGGCDKELAALFKNDPTLRLCDILKGEAREMHADYFPDYIDFMSKAEPMSSERTALEGGHSTILFGENEHFYGEMLDIDPRRAVLYNNKCGSYCNAVVLEGDATIEMDGITAKVGAVTPFMIPAAIKDDFVLTAGEKGCKAIFFEEK